MSEITLTIEQIRGMIGLEVRYHGAHYVVIEVLEDGPSLVLLDTRAEPSIQVDLYGNPNRRVPNTYTVRILSEDLSELHPDFLALELI
jgi:hypothetical protein